jgi:hypothetical protein
LASFSASMVRATVHSKGWNLQLATPHLSLISIWPLLSHCELGRSRHTDILLLTSPTDDKHADNLQNTQIYFCWLHLLTTNTRTTSRIHRYTSADFTYWRQTRGQPPEYTDILLLTSPTDDEDTDNLQNFKSFTYSLFNDAVTSSRWDWRTIKLKWYKESVHDTIWDTNPEFTCSE